MTRCDCSCELLSGHAAVYGLRALVYRHPPASCEAAKVPWTRLIIGWRLDLTDGPDVLVVATELAAYSLIRRLVSLAKRRAVKAKWNLDWIDLRNLAEGLIAVLVADETDEICAQLIRRLKVTFAASHSSLIERHRDAVAPAMTSTAAA